MEGHKTIQLELKRIGKDEPVLQEVQLVGIPVQVRQGDEQDTHVLLTRNGVEGLQERQIISEVHVIHGILHATHRLLDEAP